MESEKKIKRRLESLSFSLSEVFIYFHEDKKNTWALKERKIDDVFSIKKVCELFMIFFPTSLKSIGVFIQFLNWVKWWKCAMLVIVGNYAYFLNDDVYFHAYWLFCFNKNNIFQKNNLKLQFIVLCRYLQWLTTEYLFSQNLKWKHL